MSAPSFRSSRTAAALVAALLLVMLAPSGAAAKKKKKQDKSVLSGLVVNQAEEPLAGVAVTVNATAGAEFTGRATTDKKGEFAIEVNAEGSYLLRLESEGYTPFEDTLFLALGEEQSIKVQMLDAATGRRNEAIRAYNAGAAAFEAKDLATAKEHFLAATAAEPSLAEPYLVLADIHLTEGAHQQAAAAAEKFLELVPGDPKGQMLAYEAYQKLDELRTTLAGSELAPQLAKQTFNEGAIAHQKGDLETATRKFEAAIDFDPDLAEAHAALASIHYNQQRFDEALVHVEKALALKPRNASSHRVRCLIHDALGDQAAADRAMDEYIAVDAAGAADLLYLRADRDFRDNQPELAKAGLLRALELAPDLARAHFTLGKIYASTDTAKAREHLQKFVELAPDDPEVATAKEMMKYF